MASSVETLFLATLIHMIIIELNSTNYLLWKGQILPLPVCQNFLGYVDGTKPTPSPITMNGNGSSMANRAYEQWRLQDQRLVSLLLSLLTEESMSEVLGCTTSLAIWLALEAAYNHNSKSCELRLKDNLQLMKKGSRSVTKYGCQFKHLCDQLASIGRPVDDTDKAHWFLRGLGPSFSSFSAAQMTLTLLPMFRDLLSKAESFSLFQESLKTSCTFFRVSNKILDILLQARIESTLDDFSLLAVVVVGIFDARLVAKFTVKKDIISVYIGSWDVEKKTTNI